MMQSMRKTSKKNQQGAIGLFGVLTLMMAVLFVAVAVDSGRMWMEKRKLQNIADMAAIAAGGQVGGCVENNSDVYRMAAQGAAMANGYQGSLLAAPNVVELGGYSTDEGGVRTFVANGERRAVHVLATQEVPSSLFAGGIFNQRIVLQAEAVAAVRASFAAFGVGSTAVNLNTEASILNSILGKALGSSINLTAISYQGLADSKIQLLNLVRANGNLGSVTGLLNKEVSLAELVELVDIAAKQDENSLRLINSVALDGLLSATRGMVNTTLPKVALGNILKISNPSDNAVLATHLNVLQLLNSIALAQVQAAISNGNNFVDIGVPVTVPGLVNLATRLTVTQAPQIAIGPPAGGANRQACTFAETAQISVMAIASVNALGLASVDLALKLGVAEGKASLMEVNLRGANETLVLINARPGLASLRLTNKNDDSRGAIVKLIAGLVPLAEIGLNLNLAPQAETPVSFEVDHPVNQNLPMVIESFGGAGASLASLLGNKQIAGLEVKLLGLDLLGVVGLILEPVVRPVLVAIGAVLDSLLKLLGVSTVGVTVILSDVNSGNLQPLLR